MIPQFRNDAICMNRNAAMSITLLLLGPDPATNPVRATVDSVRAMADPVRATVDPVRITVDPVRATVNPVRVTVDQVRTTVDPELATVDPVRLTVDPVRDPGGRIGTPPPCIRVRFPDGYKSQLLRIRALANSGLTLISPFSGNSFTLF